MASEDGLDQAVERATADLATRLGLRPDGIDVVSAGRVTWPDGALGCPQPGMTYEQGPVPGYRVILRRAGRVYLYHAGSDGVPFICASDERDGGRDFVPPPGIPV